MGALGHYLESEGLATASISLIRLHTEKIKPPRALWVPFELGRPFGVPDDAAFQRQVLMSLLGLLAEPNGPVLVDYPEDVPGAGAHGMSGQDLTGMACPMNFEKPATGVETLPAAVAREIAQLQPWHDLAHERRGRTTFGSAGLPIADVAAFLCRWLDDVPPESPRPDQTTDAMLKLASEDLKAFYFEAVAAQPQFATHPMTARQLADWFWGETSAAKLFVALRERCIRDQSPARQLMGRNHMVPREQWGRFGITERWWRKPAAS